MPLRMVEPDIHFLPEASYSPSVKRPVIVYRRVFSRISLEASIGVLRRNKWLEGERRKGHYRVEHFHSNCHEAYMALNGSATYHLGALTEQENGEDVFPGLLLTIYEDDLLIVPAGASHGIVEGSEFEYSTFYPEGSPKYDMHYLDQLSINNMARIATAAEKVGVPSLDPLYGASGKLMCIWKTLAVK